MQKDRGFRALAIAAICVAVVALSIGYAALSQSLDIDGTTTVKGNTWDVGFETLEVPTLDNGNLTGSATEISSSISVTTLDFAINLVLPGDSVTYVWTVHNKGSIDAMLSDAPVLNGIDAALAENVTYTFTYNNGDEILANDILEAGAKEKLKLTVKFSELASQLPATDIPLSLNTTLTYVQA